MRHARFNCPAALRLVAVWLVWGLVQAGCSPAPQPLQLESSHVQRDSAWANGDFETDALGQQPPTGWSLTSYVGGGLSGTAVAPPQSLTALGLSAGGVQETSVVGGAAASQIDPDLGTGQSFRFPKYGARAARINYQSASVNGDNRNVNALQQRMSLSSNDIDPTDNQMHVRFAVAPVLENPSHPFSQQPFYYIELINLTRGTTLYRAFNVAGQSGVPWNTTTSLATRNTTQWVDWQLVDIAPGNDALSLGDQVQLTAVAGGCSLGGHFGRLYVDGLGASVPGLYATAHGPQTASPNQTIAYSVAYANGAATSAAGAYVKMTTPPQTTFQSVSIPGCTTPAVGSAGVVTCPLGVLPAGAAGQFTVQVAVASFATGSITNGTYSIGASGVLPLLGMPTSLQVQQAAVTYADVITTAGVQASAAKLGDTTGFSYTVTNNGPADLGPASIGVVGNIAPGLKSASWTCALSAGDANTSRCGIAAGNGNIVSRPVLASGAAVTYSLQATVDPTTTVSVITQSLVANVVTASIDPDTTNNAASTQLSLGAPRTLKIAKAGTASAGSIGAVPAAIQCGPSCTMTQGLIADGALVRLVAIPTPNAVFNGWAGDCTGSQLVCTFTMTADAQVTAKFTPLPAAESPSSIVVYDGQSQYARLGQAFPQPLTALVTDATGAPAAGVSVNFAVAAANATLDYATAITDAWGLARSQVTASSTQGSYTVAASTPGVAQTANFTLYNVGAAKTLSYVVGTGQSAAAGSIFSQSLIARVLDSAGYPVPGATVSFTAPTSGASARLSAPAAVTDAQGYAALLATANTTTGDYSITAATSGVKATLAFTMTNTAPSATAAYAVAGTPQTTQAQAGFTQPLVAVVTNSTGDAMPNVTVSFKAPSTGPSAALSAATALTDESGQARIAATANAIPGSYIVTASVGTSATKASFALTNNGSRYLLSLMGDGQSATVGTAFSQSLTVQLSDSSGAPVPGSTVNFAVPTSGAVAALQSPNATTNLQGYATTNVTAGNKAGSYQVIASAAGVASPATLSLTNAPGPAAALQLVSGNNQSQSVQATFAQAIVLRVVDNQNNAVPGAVVQFAVPETSLAGTLSSASATTDASGLVSVSAAAGKLVGSFYITASLPGAASVQQTLTMNTTAGALAQLIAVSGSGQNAVSGTTFAQPLVVRALDAFNNPVSGASLQPLLSFIGPSASFAAAPPVSDANGFINVRLSASRMSGAYVLNLYTQGASAPAAFNLANLAGPATNVFVADGDTQTTVVTQPMARSLAVRVTDGNGNAAPGAQLIIEAVTKAPGVRLSGDANTATAVADSNGMAFFPTSANTVAGSFTVNVALVGGNANALFHLTNVAGPGAALVAQSGQGQEAAVAQAFAQPLVVRVNDAYGNLVSAASVRFTAPGSGASASLSAKTCTTSAGGLCQISATALSLAGPFNIIADLGGDDLSPLAPQAVFALNVRPGPASQLQVVGGDGQSAAVDANFVQPLVACVTDAGNNPVGGVSVGFLAPVMGPTWSRITQTALTDAQGQASIIPQAGHLAGDYNVSVGFAGLAAPRTAQLHNLAGPAAKLTLVSGDKQSSGVLADLPAPLVVQVTDIYGNVVQGANVILSAPTDGPSALFDAPVLASDANGRASFAGHTSAVSGSYTMTATLDGTNAQVVFSLKNLAGPPVAIGIVSGDGQQLAVDSALSAPLIAVVTDAQSNPVPNVAIRFITPVSGAGLELYAPSYTTNGKGLVGGQGLANTVAGTYQVQATLPDSSACTFFNLTNVPGGATSLTVVSGDQQTVVVGTPFGDALTVAVADAQNNPVQGAHVSFVVHTPSAGVSLGTTSVQTNAQGLAIVQATALRVPGAASIDVLLDDGTTRTMNATLVPGAAVSIVADPQASVQAATVATSFVAPLGVTTYDSFGNVVPNVALTYAGPSSGPGAVLETTSIVTDKAGYASLAAGANTIAGIYTVAVSMDNVPGPHASFLLHNLAGPPHALQTLSGAQASAQVQTAFAQSLRVVLRDLHGNPVPNVPVQFAAPPSAPTAVLDNSLVFTDTDGTALVHALAGAKSGSYAVTASYISGQRPAVFALTNTPGPMASLALDSQATPQFAQLATRFAQPLRMVATDAGGNPIAGVTLSLNWPTSGASAALATSSLTTDIDGAAQVSAVANHTPGSYAVVATDAASGLQASFNLSNLTGPAATLASVNDVSQATEVMTSFAQPLSVVVTDSLGSGIADVPVRFVVPQTGASATLSSATVTTDDNGVATSYATANKVAGHYNVVASYEQAAAPFVLRLQNIQAPATSVTLVTNASPQAAAVKQAFAQPLAISVRDAYGNPKTNQTVVFTVPAQEPRASLSSMTAVTDASGTAVITAVAGAQAGSYIVQATVQSSGGSASFALQNTSQPPPVIAVAQGAQQQVTAAQGFGTPVAFVLRSSDGDVIANADVTITSEPAGLVLGSETYRTDSNGYVSVVVSAGRITGNFKLTARSAAAQAPATAQLTVSPIATSIALTVDEPSVALGARTQMRVLAQSADAGLTGKVVFSVDGRDVGMVALGAAGDAALSTPALGVGHHTLVARLQADHPYAQATSNTADVAVERFVMSGGGSCAQRGAASGYDALITLAGVIMVMRAIRQPGRRP